MPPAVILVSILLFASPVGPIVGTLLAVPAAVIGVALVQRLSPEKMPSDEEPTGNGDTGGENSGQKDNNR